MVDEEGLPEPDPIADRDTKIATAARMVVPEERDGSRFASAIDGLAWFTRDRQVEALSKLDSHSVAVQLACGNEASASSASSMSCGVWSQEI